MPFYLLKVFFVRLVPGPCTGPSVAAWEGEGWGVQRAKWMYLPLPGPDLGTWDLECLVQITLNPLSVAMQALPHAAPRP